MNKQKKLKKNRIKIKKESEQIQPISGGGKRNTRKQNKIFSKHNNKFVTDFAASGFGVVTK